MIELSFPTIELGKYIKEIKCKVKNTDLKQDDLIVYGVTNAEGVTITNNKASEDLGDYTVLSGNQFVYNPYRINVGSIGLSSSDTIGVVSPAYVVFETTKDINSEFLLHYLKSSLGINLIKWYGDRGGVRSALRFADLKKIDFPDISIEQQLDILDKVKKIDSGLCKLDDNLSLDNLSSLRQSILQQAVEGKLCQQDPTDEPASMLLEKIKAEKEKLIVENKIKKQKELPHITDEEKPFDLPQGWTWCRLSNITNLITSGSRDWAKYYSKDGAKFIRMGNLSRNSFDLKMENIQYVLPPQNGEGSRTRLEQGDMLLSITGEVGLLGLVPVEFGEAYINQHTALLRFSKMLETKYYAFGLLSPLCQKQFNATQRGIKNSFRLSDIEYIIFPLPPLAEQQRIAKKVDKLMALCDELELEVINARKYVSQLMEAVLQEAFSSPKGKHHNNVIEFAPKRQEEEVLLTAARGGMKEDTWSRLRARAIEIADEEI